MIGIEHGREPHVLPARTSRKVEVLGDPDRRARRIFAVEGIGEGGAVVGGGNIERVWSPVQVVALVKVCRRMDRVCSCRAISYRSIRCNRVGSGPMIWLALSQKGEHALLSNYRWDAETIQYLHCRQNLPVKTVLITSGRWATPPSFYLTRGSGGTEEGRKVAHSSVSHNKG